MFALKRNQIIITALIVMIAVAGFLNYQDSKNPSVGDKIAINDAGEIDALAPASVNNDSYIGDALVYEDDNPSIATEESTQASSNDGTGEAGEAVFVSSAGANTDAYVNTASGGTYFVQAKLDREQTRAKEKEVLTSVINNANIDQAQKATAADSMLDIQKRIEKESAAEALIESKGFSEVYVRIDDTSVDVVVNKEALTDAEIAQITDIVKRKTGMNVEQIHISPMRK